MHLNVMVVYLIKLYTFFMIAYLMHFFHTHSYEEITFSKELTKILVRFYNKERLLKLFFENLI